MGWRAGSRLRGLEEGGGEGRVGESDGAAVMRSGCAHDDTKTRWRADGWVGPCTCNEIGAILVSVLIFILFLHIRDEKGQVEYILVVFIPLYIPLYIPNNH